MDMDQRKSLSFVAVLQPEDYGPVIRCLIIQAVTEENLRWLETYKFPGPVRDRFRSDSQGNQNPMGTYYTVFPISGPEISWTQGFRYNEKTDRNEYKTPELPGLKCARMVCPAANNFTRRRNFTSGKITLRYVDYLPEAYSKSRKGVRTTRKGTLPLIIWLHGMGEGGVDPTLVLLGNRVTALAEATVQCYFPETGAAVMAPQCPTLWMDVDGTGRINDWQPDLTDGYSFYTEALKGLILHYLQNHPEIDRSRIYIGGCSNGGFMTLNMLLAMPGFFAAAFPICPAYNARWMNPGRISLFSKTPMWITAAATDQTVPLRGADGNPAYADALYEKLLAYAGQESLSGTKFGEITLPNLVYSRLPQVMGYDSQGFPYEYYGHFSWIPVLQDRITKEFDREEIHLFEWLAAKRLESVGE
jgi:predicted esterase